MRKIFLLIYLIKNCNFIFSPPKVRKIILFDCEQTKYLEKIFKKEDYFILTTRIHNFKYIYINRFLFLFLFKNFFKRSFKLNYLLWIINQINPKLIVTHVDNSTDFHILSKILYKKIFCAAIQRATRGELLYNPKSIIKTIFIPHFFTFSSHEKKLYRSKKALVKKFYPSGSLVLALAMEYFKKKKISKKIKYDICLISEPHENNSTDFPQVKNYADVVGLIAQFTHRLCKEENLKLIFCGTGEKNNSTAKHEMSFYKKYLKKFKFKIFQASRKTFPSYMKIMQSNLIIGHNSSMLREAVGIEKKVLFCNFTGSSLVKPQPAKGIIELTNPSYEIFKKRVLKILSTKKNYYWNSINTDQDHILMSSKHTLRIIKSQLEKVL